MSDPYPFSSELAAQLRERYPNLRGDRHEVVQEMLRLPLTEIEREALWDSLEAEPESHLPPLTQVRQVLAQVYGDEKPHCHGEAADRLWGLGLLAGGVRYDERQHQEHLERLHMLYAGTRPWQLWLRLMILLDIRDTAHGLTVARRLR